MRDETYTSFEGKRLEVAIPTRVLRRFNMLLKSVLVVFVITTVASCASPPPPAETVLKAEQTAQAENAASKPTEGRQRADALLAELQKREAEYKEQEATLAARDRLKKYESEPTRSAPIAETISQSSAATSSGTAVAPPAATPAAESGHDEAWWKNEMRRLQVQFEEDFRRFDAAMAAWKGAIESMNTKSITLAASAQDSALRSEREAQQLKATVQSDRDAIERLREDARRANVPPGWLRWP